MYPTRRSYRLRPVHLAVTSLALLTLVDPAVAGNSGNLQPAGTLLLELDASTSRFRLDDGDNDPSNDRFQAVFDQKLNRNADACLVGLAPPDTAPGVATGDAQLVSLPGPTDWGIDEGKLALGGRARKGGTGCGQLESGEVLHLRSLGLLMTDASIQIEAKQDAAARVILIYDDGVTQTEVGRRYLLSGRAVSNPPAEAAAHPDDVSVVLSNRPDGGPDSGNNDDGFWTFRAPLHNVEVFEILANADGTEGKLSLKGGAEYPDPSRSRSEWTVFDIDGLIGCGDDFSCKDNEDCTNEEGSVSGNRTDTGAGDACTAVIPFELAFDGEQVTFNFLDTTQQNPGIALDVAWESEAAQFPIDETVLSYDPAGVDCEQAEFTNTCIPLTLCQGTPIRSCSNNPTQACEEDAECGSGNRCRLVDLVAPGSCSDGSSCQVDADCTDQSSCVVGFPDLVPSSPDTTEYGCICEEHVVYLGPGRCANGDSCQVDAECSDGSVCEDRVAVDQCLFFVGDAVFLRSGKKTR